MSRYAKVAKTNIVERDVQTSAVKILRGCGFTVCVTSNNKKTANTKGTPDAFVLIPSKKRWFAIEFKKPDGKLSPEQQWLYDMGATTVIRSDDDTLQFIKKNA